MADLMLEELRRMGSLSTELETQRMEVEEINPFFPTINWLNSMTGPVITTTTTQLLREVGFERDYTEVGIFANLFTDTPIKQELLPYLDISRDPGGNLDIPFSGISAIGTNLVQDEANYLLAGYGTSEFAPFRFLEFNDKDSLLDIIRGFVVGRPFVKFFDETNQISISNETEENPSGERVLVTSERTVTEISEDNAFLKTKFAPIDENGLPLWGTRNVVSMDVDINLFDGEGEGITYDQMIETYGDIVLTSTVLRTQVNINEDTITRLYVLYPPLATNVLFKNERDSFTFGINVNWGVSTGTPLFTVTYNYLVPQMNENGLFKVLSVRVRYFSTFYLEDIGNSFVTYASMIRGKPNFTNVESVRRQILEKTRLAINDDFNIQNYYVGQLNWFWNIRRVVVNRPQRTFGGQPQGEIIYRFGGIVFPTIIQFNSILDANVYFNLTNSYLRLTILQTTPIVGNRETPNPTIGYDTNITDVVDTITLNPGERIQNRNLLDVVRGPSGSTGIIPNPNVRKFTSFGPNQQFPTGRSQQ